MKGITVAEGQITRQAIVKLVDKQDLSFDEAEGVMNEIMSGQTSPTQNAAYLAALSTKNANAETIDEIAGSAKAMRDHAKKVNAPFPTLEIVGTGGDGANTFNISTTAMFVLAAGGVKVAKHGNRGASSKSGAADCLEALGVNIVEDPDQVVKLLDEVGAAFMFAQHYHPAMKYVGPIRKELGVRTVFNILGPLTNPASPEYFLLGVYDSYLVPIVGRVLGELGVKHGLVVYGQDRLDELSISAPTHVGELKDGEFHTFDITPEEVGLTRGSKESLRGGTPEENAQITRDILSGKIKDARRDIVVLNAGAGFYAANVTPSIREGVELAAKCIDDGSAAAKLDQLVEASNR